MNIKLLPSYTADGTLQKIAVVRVTAHNKYELAELKVSELYATTGFAEAVRTTDRVLVTLVTELGDLIPSQLVLFGDRANQEKELRKQLKRALQYERTTN